MNEAGGNFNEALMEYNGIYRGRDGEWRIVFGETAEGKRELVFAMDEAGSQELQRIVATYPSNNSGRVGGRKYYRSEQD